MFDNITSDLTDRNKRLVFVCLVWFVLFCCFHLFLLAWFSLVFNKREMANLRFMMSFHFSSTRYVR